MSQKRTTVAAARQWTGAKDLKKIGNNTFEYFTGDGRVIRLHHTDILIFSTNGDIVVSSGRWRTHTTAARIREYLPYPWLLKIMDFGWFIVDARTKKRYPLDDNTRLCPDGSVWRGDYRIDIR